MSRYVAEGALEEAGCFGTHLESYPHRRQKQEDPSWKPAQQSYSEKHSENRLKENKQTNKTKNIAQMAQVT
jgi:hypothetical protein